MDPRSEELIRLLQLIPHPEGGYYREVYRSADTVISTKGGDVRNAVTDIYFLLTADKPSRFHRVVHDEIWNYYEGDPVEILEINPDTLEFSSTVLGCRRSVIRYKHFIKSNTWQAARTIGDYSLAGCTVAPGFDYSDLKFLKDDAIAGAAILKKYPGFAHLV